MDSVIVVKRRDALGDTVDWMVATREWGIDDRNAPGTPISVAHVVFGPRQGGRAHYHPFASVVYQIRGIGRTYFGERLERFVDSEPGDFVYIPANVIHKPVNLTDEVSEGLLIRDAPHEIAIPSESPAT